MKLCVFSKIKCQKFALCLMLLPLITSAQVGLGQPDVWFYEPAPSYHASNLKKQAIDLIGNHPILKQDSVIRAFNKIQALPERGYSIFLVVRPLYQNISGKSYVRFKGLEITDSKIMYRGAGREFNPDKNKPLILSASFPASTRRGGQLARPVIDTTMFKVSEIIAYNRLFSKEELRLMEAYLSLKYSIPTTVNDNQTLRRYPTDSTNKSYWTPKHDKIYDREVIALGNFSFSGIQQSQTVAYHDDSLIVALDTIVPFGQMPQQYLQEGAFMILSKRIDQSSVYDCELHLNQQFPITAWRIRTKNFHGTADSLRLYYPSHQASSFNDTLILTDGLDTINLKVEQLGSDLKIALALANILPNRLYRFRVKSNLCDDTASIGLSPLEPGLMALNVDPFLLPLQVKVNAVNGSTQVDTLMHETPLLIRPGSEQYAILVENENGDLQSDFLIAGSDTIQQDIQFVESGKLTNKELASLQQRVLVYPNPGFTGEEAFFEFHRFPIDEPIKVSVFDPQGKLIHQEELKVITSLHKWSYTLGLPGYYSFVFSNASKTFTKKLTVQKRF
tara:strand:+ start:13358 stop:15040 length:1683 start_codon:yes stop_codon:yes gene_type:complete